MFNSICKKMCTNGKINDKINDKINAIDKRILQLLSGNSYLTIPEISVLISRSEPTVHRHLNDLIAHGLIERICSRKTGYWKVKSN